eukprot:Hpha_TRINITY_DN6000_c0_g1::TRINITY_DN6000_c0_g1_i1::g.63393::m.63393
MGFLHVGLPHSNRGGSFPGDDPIALADSPRAGEGVRSGGPSAAGLRLQESFAPAPLRRPCTGGGVAPLRGCGDSDCLGPKRVIALPPALFYAPRKKVQKL